MSDAIVRNFVEVTTRDALRDNSFVDPTRLLSSIIPIDSIRVFLMSQAVMAFGRSRHWGGGLRDSLREVYPIGQPKMSSQIRLGKCRCKQLATDQLARSMNCEGVTSLWRMLPSAANVRILGRLRFGWHSAKTIPQFGHLHVMLCGCLFSTIHTFVAP